MSTDVLRFFTTAGWALLVIGTFFVCYMIGDTIGRKVFEWRYEKGYRYTLTQLTGSKGKYAERMQHTMVFRERSAFELGELDALNEYRRSQAQSRT